MRILITAFIAVSLLAGCSSSERVSDRRMINDSFYGTIVSVQESNTADYGRGLSATADKTMGNMARAMNNMYVAPSTGGHSTIFNELFGGGSPTLSDYSAQRGYSYIIETESGQRVKVLAPADREFAPGDQVMVVRNGEGYQNVFPRQISPQPSYNDKPVQGF